MVQVIALRSDWLIASRGFDGLDVIGHFLDILCLFQNSLQVILSHENEFEMLENEPL